MTGAVGLDALNEAESAAFVTLLTGVFENAPWVAERAAAGRPYATVAALHEGMMRVVTGCSVQEQRGFVGGHPDLAGQAARSGDIEPASVVEQAGLGLNSLTDAELEAFNRLNAAYRARFGFPFVICARRQTRDAVLDTFKRRLANDEATELAAALMETGHITRLRIVERVEGPGMPSIAGRLSTHVLDTHLGGAAAGVRIELHEIGRSARTCIATAETNAEGRTDRPILGGTGPLRIGTYELVFQLGAYFAARGVALSDPPFLDVVPLRFGIADPEGHYHVPLIATPWSFSTYRGG